MANKLIASGAWCQILANGLPVGLVNGASYDEDWQISPATVVGYLGPVDYESMGYSCALSIGAYVPEVAGSGPWPDGGVKTISDFLPTRSQLQKTNGKPAQFDLLQFVNISTGEIVNQFRDVMIASNGSSIAPGQYVTINLRLMAIERTI